MPEEVTGVHMVRAELDQRRDINVWCSYGF